MQQTNKLVFFLLKLGKSGFTIQQAIRLKPQELNYFKAYRLIRKLIQANFLKKLYPNARPAIYVTTPKGLDFLHAPRNDDVNLFAAAQNSNPPQNPSGLLPKRCRPERKQAIELALKFKLLTPLMRDIIAEKYEEYTDFTRKLVIVLRKRDIPISDLDPARDVLTIPYKTRFTSEERKKAITAKYYAIWKNVPQNIQYAVHVTLTLDPKKFNNLWEANKSASKLFNKFMSWVQKTLGFRPLYLKVAEFQKNGQIHYHVILFDIKRLLDFRKLSRILDRQGFGKIVHLYTLKRTPKGWKYARKRPKKCKPKQSADSYLAKYVAKGQYAHKETSLYWLFNVRYYSNSRKLLEKRVTSSYSAPEFIFWLTCPEFELPLIFIQPTTIETKPPPRSMILPENR